MVVLMMVNRIDITDEQLYFEIYCITDLSCNWNMNPSDVYKLISEKINVLDDYTKKHRIIYAECC